MKIKVQVKFGGHGEKLKGNKPRGGVTAGVGPYVSPCPPHSMWVKYAGSERGRQ